MNKFQPRKKPEAPKINRYLLKFTELRVISESGENLGLMSPKSALKLAEEAQLDLVLISESEKSTVARIIDYGKFKYLESKNKVKTKVQETKTVQVSPNIGINDLNRLIKKTNEFLEKGHNVVISCFFRKRKLIQKAFLDLGKQKIQTIIDGTSCTILSEIKLNGKKMMCTLKKK